MSTGYSRKRRWWLGAIWAGITAIAILSLLTFLQLMRDGQQWLDCHRNLKQIGLALQNYETSMARFHPRLFQTRLADRC